MFELKNIVFKDILNINNLTLSSEQVTTLFGESGSGKSTLMKLLNRLISPEKGEVFYNSTSLTDINPISLRREVVMLAQSPAMFGGSVKDNLLIGLNFSQKDLVSDIELKEMLNKLGVHKQLTASVEEMSGGEKQRIAFGRVMLMNPKVYLLDEPTSALDEATETEVMDLFFNYVREHSKTVVMVTHSKKVSEKYSDNIIKMREINDERGLII